MSKRTPYSMLPLAPWLVASTVCSREYTGAEMGAKFAHPQSFVEEIEKARKAMTEEQRVAFCDIADQWCEDAYNCKAKWFEKIVKAKDNRGRDQLYVWVTHWLSAYLNDPAGFKTKMASAHAYAEKQLTESQDKK